MSLPIECTPIPPPPHSTTPPPLLPSSPANPALALTLHGSLTTLAHPNPKGVPNITNPNPKCVPNPMWAIPNRARRFGA